MKLLFYLNLLIRLPIMVYLSDHKKKILSFQFIIAMPVHSFDLTNAISFLFIDSDRICILSSSLSGLRLANSTID